MSFINNRLNKRFKKANLRKHKSSTAKLETSLGSYNHEELPSSQILIPDSGLDYSQVMHSNDEVQTPDTYTSLAFVKQPKIKSKLFELVEPTDLDSKEIFNKDAQNLSSYDDVSPAHSLLHTNYTSTSKPDDEENDSQPVTQQTGVTRGNNQPGLERVEYDSSSGDDASHIKTINSAKNETCADVKEEVQLESIQTDEASTDVEDVAQPESIQITGAYSDDEDVAVLSSTEKEEVSIAKEIEAIKKTTIESYFEKKSLNITSFRETEIITPISNLASIMATNFLKTKNFIRFIRDNITKKRFDILYCMGYLSYQEKTSIVSLAEKLNDYGVISNFFYNKANNTIKCTISQAPKCINFINGDFLELYAKNLTLQTIQALAAKHDCDYEVYSNVTVAKAEEIHELDLVFRVGNHVFWSEVKSGKFNPDEYRKLGINLGFIPNSLILLSADKTIDMAASISYFNDFYCTNISTFADTLTTMVDKTFEEDQNNA